MYIYVKRRRVALKKLILTSAVTFCLVLSGCGQTENAGEGTEKEFVAEEVNGESASETEGVNGEETMEEKGVEDVSNEDEGEAAEQEPSFELTQELYTEGSITIEYPQIKHLADEAKKDRINSLLFDEALKVMNYYENTEELELDIGYTITYESPSFLSVQYAGTGYVEGAAHPNKMFYTTNIDLENGNKIRLTDVVKVDNAFIEFFKSDAFKAVNPEVEDIGVDVKANVSKASFLNADNLDSIETDQHSETFTYFTEDRLGISISASYAVGGHLEFEISYEDVPAEFMSSAAIKELLQ